MGVYRRVQALGAGCWGWFWGYMGGGRVLGDERRIQGPRGLLLGVLVAMFMGRLWGMRGPWGSGESGAGWERQRVPGALTSMQNHL